MTKAMVANILALTGELNMVTDKPTVLRRHRAVTLIEAVPSAVSRDTVARGAISARINATWAGVSCNCGSLAHLAGGLDKTPGTPRLMGNVNV